MTTSVLFSAVGNKERLVDQVVHDLQRLILGRRLAPGMRLPPERELAEQLGVSRTILREAIHVLVAKGLLETKPGVGTLVREMGVNHISEPLNLYMQTQGITLDHLHQVRSILEVESAGLAATQATAEDIAELERIVSRMEQNMDDVVAFIDGDSDYHRTLAKTSHNPLLVVLLDSIRDLMQEVRLQVHRHPEIYATVVPDHRKILEYIIARDSDAARQAMQEHLEHARAFQEAFLAQKRSGG